MRTLITLTLIFCITATALGNTRRADRLYERWEYYKAAKLYKREAEKRPSQEVYYKLGQCYQKMYKYQQALDAYRKVEEMGSYSEHTFYWNYGLVLKSNDLYKEAKTAFEKYQAMAPDDKNVATQIRSCDIVVKDKAGDLPIAVTNLSDMNTADEAFAPMPYRKGIVFASSRPNARHVRRYPWTGERYLELYYAEEANNATDFRPPVTMSGSVINQRYHDGPATFTNDFDTIYINRVSKDLKGKEKRTLGIERNKIYMAHYEDGKWMDPQPFPYNSDTFSVATPFLSKDGSRLYFSSDMPGGFGQSDIYYCQREGSGWGTPINMGASVNTSGKEKFPTMDDADNLYFSSDGYAGYGGMDMCVSHMSGGTMKPAAVLKSPLNSGGNDEGLVLLTPTSGYFSSDRTGGYGEGDIYHFDMETGPCTVPPSEYIIGYQCKDLPVAPLISELSDKEIEEMPVIKVINVLIHFDYNKYNILSEEEEDLEEVLEFMTENPKVRVDIVGHTDSRGSAGYNDTLSYNRARAAMNYLVANGISARRIRIQGRGFNELVNDCAPGVPCSERKHRLNRRVEFKFREKGKVIVPQTIVDPAKNEED